MSLPFRVSLSLGLSVLFVSSAALANEPLMKIKSVLTNRPLVVFSEPGKKSDELPSIHPEQFAAVVNMPVLEESGSYIKVSMGNGKPVWILSEKVRLARSASCGTITPADVVTTVKRETNASRGIGEACAKESR